MSLPSGKPTRRPYWGPPPPLGDPPLGLRLTPLTEKDAQELLKPLEGHVDPKPYQEMVLRVSRLLEEFPEVERLELELSGPRVARFEVLLGAR